MQSAFEQLRGFFCGYDYSVVLDAEPVNVLRVYLGEVDHVLDIAENVSEETGGKQFRGMVTRLSATLSANHCARHHRRPYQATR